MPEPKSEKRSSREYNARSTTEAKIKYNQVLQSTFVNPNREAAQRYRCRLPSRDFSIGPGMHVIMTQCRKMISCE